MAQVVTPALVLRKFEFGESSQVLHLFTRDHGRVHALAKGSCKPRSSFQGPLDVLELGDARFYPRREGLAVLGAFERRTHFPSIRADLDRLQAAFTLLERLLHASHENHADLDLFHLALATLDILGGCAQGRVAVEALRFDLRLLQVLGMGPDFRTCAGCGRSMEEETRPLLSAARGGTLCPACSDQDHLAMGATLGVLRALGRLADADASGAARISLSRTDMAHARRLTDSLVEHALQHRIGGGVRR